MKLDEKGDEALEEQGCSVATSSTKKIEPKSIEKADTKDAEASEEQGCSVSSSSAAFPSIDLLREELSCAVSVVNPFLNLGAPTCLSIEGVFFSIFLFYCSINMISLNLQICLEICFEPSTTPCGHRYDLNGILINLYS